MKIIIFSDLHAHQFAEFSSISENGINSRLEAHLSVLDQIKAYATDSNIKTILFGGDMYHTRPSVNTQTQFLTSDRLMELAEKAKLYLLPGNHDSYSKDSKYNSLDILHNFSKGNIQICKDTTQELSKGIFCHFVEYDDDLNKVKGSIKKFKKFKKDNDGYHILLLHTEIKDSQTPAGYTFESGLSSKSLARDFDMVFNGHIHKHQKFYDNVYNIGNPLHTDWGDKWNKKGFLVLDTKTNKIEFIKTEYPEFREIDELDISSHEGDTTNFYKINFDDTITESDISRIKKIIPNSVFNFSVSSDIQQRSTIDLDMDWNTIIEKYGTENCGELNKELIVQVGKDILKTYNLELEA